MSYWNYRAVRHEEKGEVYFAIHEVHYEAGGKPTSMSASPTTFQAETLEGLYWLLQRAARNVAFKEVFVPPEHWK